MSYITLNGVGYLIRVGEGRGRIRQIENRRRSIDGSLLVDNITDKMELPVEITGRVTDQRYFTIAEARSLLILLRNSIITVGGDITDNFTARAKDIGWIDGQTYNDGSPVIYRWVTATLEEV